MSESERVDNEVSSQLESFVTTETVVLKLKHYQKNIWISLAYPVFNNNYLIAFRSPGQQGITLQILTLQGYILKEYKIKKYDYYEMGAPNLFFFYANHYNPYNWISKVTQYNLQTDETTVLQIQKSQIILDMYIFGESKTLCIYMSKISDRRRALHYYRYPLSPDANHPLKITQLQQYSDQVFKMNNQSMLCFVCIQQPRKTEKLAIIITSLEDEKPRKIQFSLKLNIKFDFVRSLCEIKPGLIFINEQQPDSSGRKTFNNQYAIDYTTEQTKITELKIRQGQTRYQFRNNFLQSYDDPYQMTFYYIDPETLSVLGKQLNQKNECIRVPL